MSASNRPLCVVTGVTGAVGPIVSDELVRAGWKVRGVARRAPVGSSEHVEYRAADITDESAVRASMEGASAVVHLAALLHLDPPATPAEYHLANVIGTENVVRAAVEQNARVVYASSIVVYGGNRSEELTEASVVRPDTSYARTKVEGERAVVDAGGVVLRLAAVYGARVKGNYRRLLHAMDRGRFVRLGTGTNRRTLVYDADVARAIVMAARHERARGEIFNVTDGTVHTVNEIIDAMAAALGRKPPRLVLPVGPIRLAAAIAERLFALAGRRAPITRNAVEKYTEDVAVSGEKIRSILGFEPSRDLCAGWAETVAILRASGELR